MSPPSAAATPSISQPDSHEASKDPEEVIAESEQQWLYSDQELLASPSIVDGMPVETEREARSKGVNFITQVGIMLKLPQTTVSTAAVFLNRFLMRISLVEKKGREKPLHHYQVAAISLFIATKVEEHVRKLKEVVVACCRVAQKNPNLVVDEQTKDYWRWRDTILLNEDLMLEMLCFDLTIDSPYKILFDLLKYYNVAHNKSLRDAAWSIVNDCGLTQLCLLFPSRTIACAAIYASAKLCNVQIADDEAGQPWWAVQGVRLLELKRACNYLSNWYQNPPIRPHMGEQAYVGLRTPEHEDAECAKTRLRSSLQNPHSPQPALGMRSTVSPAPTQQSEDMVRTGSQQSLGKRGREEEEEGRDQVRAGEKTKVEKENFDNGRASGQFPRVPLAVGSRRPDAASANGARKPAWAAPAAERSEPSWKKARLEVDQNLYMRASSQNSAATATTSEPLLPKPTESAAAAAAKEEKDGSEEGELEE